MKLPIFAFLMATSSASGEIAVTDVKVSDKSLFSDPSIRDIRVGAKPVAYGRYSKASQAKRRRKARRMNQRVTRAH